MKGGRGVNVERKVEKQGDGKGKQAEREMRGKEKNRKRKEGGEGKKRKGKKTERKGEGKREGKGKWGGEGKGEKQGKAEKKGKGRELGEKERGTKPLSGHSTVPFVLTYSGILSRRIWEKKTDPVEKCASEESMPGLHLEGVGGTPLPVCTASL